MWEHEKRGDSHEREANLPDQLWQRKVLRGKANYEENVTGADAAVMGK